MFQPIYPPAWKFWISEQQKDVFYSSPKVYVLVNQLSVTELLTWNLYRMDLSSLTMKDLISVG